MVSIKKSMIVGLKTMDSIVYILKALPTTMMLWGAVILISIPLALVLVFLTWTYKRILSGPIHIYTWVLRGSPLMLQLFFIYYGLPILTNNTIILSPMGSAILAFAINYTAYFIVIFQDAFFTLAKGQIEAGLALGMTQQKVFVKILLPQAIRQSLGALSSESLNLIKDTALVATIGMADILRQSKEIVSRDATVIPFIYAFVIYLVISYIIVLIFKQLNKRYSYDVAS